MAERGNLATFAHVTLCCHLSNSRAELSFTTAYISFIAVYRIGFSLTYKNRHFNVL